MHSTRRYKICTCSVTLRELESFQNFKGFKTFAVNLRCNITYYESESFCDSSFHHIKLEKIVANLFDIKASKIVHEWNGHIETVGRPEVMETSKQYLLLRTDVLKSGWVSLYYRCASMVFFLFIAYLIVSGSNALSGWPMKETLSRKMTYFSSNVSKLLRQERYKLIYPGCVRRMVFH